jgi:peptidyl-prolyl cis-trans isomerase D
MELFRKLATNVFFKVVLGFVMLSFVIFGISGFLMGNQNSWVAKVGNTQISYSSFLNAMKNDREIILSSNKSEEALKYVDSQAFQSDVLRRLINRVMIEKLREEYQVDADRKMILQSIVKDQSFKNKDGKFDQALFEQFLAKHSLNEEKYVNEIANEITATMILQSLVLAAPTNLQSVLDQENFKQEKRVADTISLSLAQAPTPAKPSDAEIEKFFAGQKEKYSAPEMRKISYFSFSKKDFSSDFKLSDAEILAEYEKNKDQFLTPENRSFYHLVFDKKEDAESFIEKLSKTNLKADFVKLAKELKGKDLKAITLSKFTKKDFIPELVEPAFAVKMGEVSKPLESSLGFHVFLVNEINLAKPLTFEESKQSIKETMLRGREDKVMQSKISQIEDALITSSSLQEVVKKFIPSSKVVSVELNQEGKNSSGNQISEAKEFIKFVENSFTLKKGQNSKIFYSNNFDKFYVLRADEISLARQKELKEVKAEVEKDLISYNKNLLLIELARKVGDELKANPQKAVEIAAKYKAKLEKNREFPRFLSLDLQGKAMPYRNQLLNELFSLKIGEATSFVEVQGQTYMAAILRQVKESSVNSDQYERAKNNAIQQFKDEMMREFDKFLSEKHPVKINEKILSKNQE